MSALLVVALLAASERVVMVAKKAETPGMVQRVRKPVERALRRLYQREDEDVARGNALAAEGDADGALREYDKARARRPDDPRIAYDRATVLLKMDAKAAPVAAAEASQALQNGDAELKPKAAYDLALATEAMGQAEDAIRAYGAALALDPDDVDSKVNLELLLREQAQRRQSQAGQSKEEKPSQQGGQQKPQPQQGGAPRKQDQPPKDPDAGQKQQPDPQQADSQRQQAQDPQHPAQQPRPDSARPEKPVDRTEAQRLLDALRASEKQLQIWRFAKKKDGRKRSDPEKDW